jgi:hypothetical protein
MRSHQLHEAKLAMRRKVLADNICEFKQPSIREKVESIWPVRIVLVRQNHAALNFEYSFKEPLAFPSKGLLKEIKGFKNLI